MVAAARNRGEQKQFLGDAWLHQAKSGTEREDEILAMIRRNLNVSRDEYRHPRETKKGFY